MKRVLATLGLTAALATNACLFDSTNQVSAESAMTAGEATDAVSELTASVQAADLASASIELSTNFTIGGALQNAAEELRTFIATQLPCADIALADATLTVTYGAKSGACFYRGHQFSGQSSVNVVRNDMGDVVVKHRWTRFSNGLVTVDGTATVTWGVTAQTRRVQHEIEYTRVFDGRSGTGGGDRTQRALPDGIAVGMQEDGARHWIGKGGRWDLAIDAVQMRWADPVPQSGTLTLVAPSKKQATLRFARVDEDTIRCTLTSGRATFALDVTKATGEVSQVK